MNDEPLLVPVGPGLAFRFDQMPCRLRTRIQDFLAYLCGKPATDLEAPIRIETTTRLPSAEPAGKKILSESDLSVYQAADQLVFELPSLQACCDIDEGQAEIYLNAPSDEAIDGFSSLVLAPMLIELAAARGWLGVHAAALAIEGYGLLLPGPSGVGKSTIFRSASKAGLQVLSDDLVWLAPSTHGRRLVAFPRGESTAAIPWPTADNVALRAIVCPRIVDRESNRLVPLAFPELLTALLEQGGFLSSGATAGRRFRGLARLARSVPGYRLEAGRNRDEVPTLLAGLAKSEAAPIPLRDPASRRLTPSENR